MRDGLGKLDRMLILACVGSDSDGHFDCSICMIIRRILR